uniref:Uncharacterized protein n=1 Tax=Anguilla anguilla TaxID=7936 RepID=A0A0E9UL93_ANGAN
MQFELSRLHFGWQTPKTLLALFKFCNKLYTL